MSQDHLDLKLEVEIFEQLEAKTHLTLGDINKLRRVSRQQQKNLLFLAYDEQHIDARYAQEIAQTLSIETHKAPWMIDQVSRGRPTGITLNQRREAYGKHISGTNNEPKNAMIAKPLLRKNRKTHQNINAKTEIEFNIPYTIEEREWQQVTASLHNSELISGSLDTDKDTTPPIDFQNAVLPNHSLKSKLEKPLVNVSDSRDSLIYEEYYAHSHSMYSSHSNDKKTLPPMSSRAEDSLADNSLLKPHDTSPHASKDMINDLIVAKKTRNEDNTPPHGFYMSQLGIESHVGSTHSLGEEVQPVESRWQVQPYPISKWGVSQSQPDSEAFMLWEVFDQISQTTFHMITVHDILSSTPYALLQTIQLSQGIPELMWAHAKDPSLKAFFPSHTQEIYVFKSFKGRKLKQFVLENTKYSWEKRAMTLWQITYVMYQVHSKRIIHGNLSTHGIWQTAVGIQIGYWEYAHSVGSFHDTHHNQMIFDTDYTAPEVLLGHTPSFQSDVYSLGAIAFYLLTGTPPPKDQFMQKRLLQKNLHSSKIWVETCLQALSTNPKYRPLNACEFYRKLFIQDPSALHVYDTEKSTLDLNLQSSYLDLYLSQILFEAGLPIHTLHILERQGVLNTNSNDYVNYYFPLMPTACLIIPNIAHVQSISIRSLSGQNQTMSIIEDTSFHIADTYHITWTIQGNLMQWQISLQPLENRTLHLFDPSEDSWFSIPGGSSYTGSQHTDLNERVLHAIKVSTFKISSVLVSCMDYKMFLNECTPQEQILRQPKVPMLTEHEAVQGLSIEDIQAYCRWEGTVRLPYETEWERSIRGESDIEFIKQSKLSILQDLHINIAELCLTVHDKPVLKSGAWNRGYIGKSHRIHTQEKMFNVAFRVVSLT